MTIRLIPALFLAAMVAPGVARAEHENADVHVHGQTKTITVDNTDVRPESLTMDHGDVLGFTNSSTHPVNITFIEPQDLKKKIRCGFVHAKGEKHAPTEEWARFSWRDGKLVANIPPGRFASVCSLEPGTYVYTAQRVSVRGTGTGGILPAQGRIEVK